MSLIGCDRKHAYSDLKPYVCCDGKGECDLELFSSRNAWFTHELENHRHHWICVFCQQEPLNSLARFQSHVQNKHIEIPVRQIPEVAQLCKRQLQFIPAIDCPFCDDFEDRLRQRTGVTVDTEVIVVPTVIFRKHVAAHLEQLALFSLGPQNQPGEEMENESFESRDDGLVGDTDVIEHFLNDQNESEQDDAAPPSPDDDEEQGKNDVLAYPEPKELRIGVSERSNNQNQDDEEEEEQTSAPLKDAHEQPGLPCIFLVQSLRRPDQPPICHRSNLRGIHRLK
jgi:hypothetical protein